MKHPTPKQWLKRVLKAGGWGLLGGAILLGGFVGSVYLGLFGSLPSGQDLKDIRHEEASMVYSADSTLIGKFYAKNRTNVPFDALPDHLVDALIATEDVRFYEHEGVDNWALLRVAIKTILLGDREAGGGSTITQQLAKNLFGRKDHGLLSLPVNKVKEMILAKRLEGIYSKDAIIQLYLNTVPYGEDTYGIGSAARRYFDKSVQELRTEEAATLVGMLKATTYYNPHLNPEHARERRDLVLGQMARYERLPEDRADSLQALPMDPGYSNLSAKNPNGYFLARVKDRAREHLKGLEGPDGDPYELEKDGLRISTTLNNQLQQKALEARRHHLRELQRLFDEQWSILKRTEPAVQGLLKKKIQATPAYTRLKGEGLEHAAIMDTLKKEKRAMRVFDWGAPETQERSVIDSVEHYLKMLHGSIFAMDPNTGAVKVYVGGNSHTHLPYDLVLSKRQAASTFKPFILTAAIQKGMDPCRWIDNEPKVYSDHSDWTPRNYDDSKGGYYSVQGALIRSMNVPTVSIYFATGHTAVETVTDTFGFSSELPEDPSIALGSGSVSLYEMVRAYGAFANGGQRVEPYLIRSIRDEDGNAIYEAEPGEGKSILGERTATLMQQILKRVVDSGTARKLKYEYGLRGEWGGKTGTSQDYSDAWFISFNRDLVAGVWVGSRSPAVHFTSSLGSGSRAALPIFGRMMKRHQKSDQIPSITEFPEPTKGIRAQLDCPCYREENAVEEVKDFFEGLFSSGPQKKETKEEEEDKKNIFERIFGGGKDK